MTLKKRLTEAAVHLRQSDPVMRRVVDQVGPCTLRPDRNRFVMLVRSILSQQISTAAARTIRQRLTELAGQSGVTPDRMLDLGVNQLRTAGLSQRKAEYILDLSGKVSDGTVTLSTMGRLSNERVISSLVQIRGVGRWTAEMFLIFSLGRLDVFPVDDLGIRNAMADLYGLDRPAPSDRLVEIAEPWQPYASVACWYCWRHLEGDSAGW